MLRPFILSGVLFFTVAGAVAARAQGGPPLLTDDPGTPGNRNWEINLAFTQDIRPQGQSYETPILDMNYGLGDRIQLKWEIPYLVSGSEGSALTTGLGNSLAGVKWRFYQSPKRKLNISTYPQLELNNPGSRSWQRGLVAQGPNFLLPLEVTKQIGPLELNWDAGYWFSRHLSDGNILGFAAGHQVNTRLEVLGEAYHIAEVGGDRDDTFDFGGRYELHPGLLFLFMAGRSFLGAPSGQSRFIGYFGLQFQIQRPHHLGTGN
jgi:hypothetical protein